MSRNIANIFNKSHSIEKIVTNCKLETWWSSPTVFEGTFWDTELPNQYISGQPFYIKI